MANWIRISYLIFKTLFAAKQGSRHYLPPTGAQGKTVVFGLVRFLPFYFCFYLLLSVFYRRSGISSYILHDDGVLEHYDLAAAHQSRMVKLLTRLSRIFGDGNPYFLFSLFAPNLAVLPLSGLLEDGHIHKAKKISQKKYAYSDLAEQAKDAHRRKFFGRAYNSQDTAHTSFAAQSMANVYMVEQACLNIRHTLNPDLCVILDGTYSVLGTLYKMMKQLQIPLLVFKPDGFFDRSIYIGGSPDILSSQHPFWRHRATADQEKKEKARQYLYARTARDANPNPDEDPVIERLHARIRENGYQGVIGLFPNNAWDGALCSRDTIFPNIDTWLADTILWAERYNYLAILREHPQSAPTYTPDVSIVALMRELHPDAMACRNLMVIPGTEKCASYRIIREVADISVTYGGTLAIEIPVLDRPSILVARSPYSHQGIALEPISTDEYFLFIAQTCAQKSFPSTNALQSMHAQAIDAATYRFYESLFYCPIMPTRDDWSKRRRDGADMYWNSFDLHNMNPAKSPEWKRTLDEFHAPLTGQRKVS